MSQTTRQMLQSAAEMARRGITQARGILAKRKKPRAVIRATKKKRRK